MKVPRPDAAAAIAAVRAVYSDRLRFDLRAAHSVISSTRAQAGLSHTEWPVSYVCMCGRRGQADTAARCK